MIAEKRKVSTISLQLCPKENNYEVEILGIEEIDPKNLSVSKDLKTYNQKIGVSNDRSMRLSLLLCQADLKSLDMQQMSTNCTSNKMLRSDEIFEKFTLGIVWERIRVIVVSSLSL